MLDIFAQPEEDEADLSNDEFDALLIHDYCEHFLATVDPMRLAPPPESAHQDGSFAHHNERAWQLLDVADLGITRERAREILGSVRESRHLAGQHDQQTHGRRGGLRHPTPFEAMQLQRAVSAPDGGFTMQPTSGDVPTMGYAVAPYPERSRIVPASEIEAGDIRTYVADNRDVLGKPDHYVGGWHDPDSGNVYLDVSVVKQDRGEAIRLAEKTNQISIYDLGTGNTVNTGGTGEAL